MIAQIGRDPCCLYADTGIKDTNAGKGTTAQPLLDDTKAGARSDCGILGDAVKTAMGMFQVRCMTHTAQCRGSHIANMKQFRQAPPWG
jgi:hypothetical protein